jgi:hypothetical protein
MSRACDSQVFSSEIIQGSLQPLGNVFVAFASDCLDQFHAVPMPCPTLEGQGDAALEIWNSTGRYAGGATNDPGQKFRRVEVSGGDAPELGASAGQSTRRPPARAAWEVEKSEASGERLDAIDRIKQSNR